MKIIESIPISRFHLEDRNGWHFINNEKYTVKSGYEVERVYPDIESMPTQFGPSITPLKAFCWKVRCPPKMKHFLWQILTGCIAVKKNLRSRGMQGGTVCDRCGAPEESTNHVFFLMSTGGSGLGTFTDSNESVYFPHSIFVYQYGSFILEIVLRNGGSLLCLDSLVYMER